MQLALHSVSYAGVWPGQERLTLEEFIPRAAALGFAGVMLVAKRPHLSLLDYPAHQPEKRAALRALLAEHGLSVHSLAGYNDFTVGPDRPDVPFWEHQIVYIAELAALARELDCPAIRIFTGYERDGLSYDAGWTSVVTGLREAAGLAADFGVTLTVQNHHDIAADYESMYQLLAEVDHPNCRAAFDAWSPALHGLRGEALAAAVRRMAPFIAYTTVADYAALPRYRYEPALVNYVAEPARMLAVPMGEGLIDYGTFFDTLVEVGYTGTVAYEMCSSLRGGGGLDNLDTCARQFKEYMAPYAARTTAAAAAQAAR